MKIQTTVLTTRDPSPPAAPSSGQGTCVILMPGPRSQPLFETDEHISAGLAKRLHRFAVSRLDDFGFAQAAQGWDVEIYTLDGDDKPADRAYTVRFTNEKGGYLEVSGILTRSGWPSLDHGLHVGSDG